MNRFLTLLHIVHSLVTILGPCNQAGANAAEKKNEELIGALHSKLTTLKSVSSAPPSAVYKYDENSKMLPVLDTLLLLKPAGCHTHTHIQRVCFFLRATCSLCPFPVMYMDFKSTRCSWLYDEGVVLFRDSRREFQGSGGLATFRWTIF